jgi:protein-tyrosine phosphatase
MPNILVICRANQFRSVLTEHALRSHLSSPEWQIGSAGMWTEVGLPAARGLAEWSGLPEIRQHRSRTLDASLMQSADLILVMERGQREALAVEFPFAARRIYLLAEMSARLAYDIPDPALGGEEPQRLVREILGLVEKGLPRIIDLASQHAQERTT